MLCFTRLVLYLYVAVLTVRLSVFAFLVVGLGLFPCLTWLIVRFPD